MGSDEAATGPARLDVEAFLRDGEGELRRCAAQHWWARGVDQNGDPMAVVLGWEEARATLADLDAAVELIVASLSRITDKDAFIPM